MCSCWLTTEYGQGEFGVGQGQLLAECYVTVGVHASFQTAEQTATMSILTASGKVPV